VNKKPKRKKKNRGRKKFSEIGTVDDAREDQKPSKESKKSNTVYDLLNINSDIKTNDKKTCQIDSAVLLLERTHHDNSLMEVISPVCIKETANIKNGDTVTIELKEFPQIS